MEPTYVLGWNAALADVLAVPVPEETPSFYPVPNGRFIEEVKLHIPRFGLSVAGESYALAQDGMQMFGVLNLQATHDDYAIAIGLRNSYNKTLSVGLVMGMTVFVCSNLAFNGEVTMHRKHTVHVFRDLPDLIYKMLASLASIQERQEHEIALWKTLALGEKTADHLIMESIRKDVIPVSKLPYILDAWEHPAYPDFEPRTAWSLYNAFTGIAKSRSERAQMESTLALSQVFRTVLV